MSLSSFTDLSDVRFRLIIEKNLPWIDINTLSNILQSEHKLFEQSW